MSKYSNPPIQEAVIEIKFTSGIPGGFQAVEKLAQSIDEELQPWGQNVRIQTQVDDYNKREQQQIVGVALQDEASKCSLHLDVDRIAYMLLGSYDSWKVFQEAFLNYWSAFGAIMDEDTCIQRVGVRFINKIKLQLADLGELEQYTPWNLDVDKYDGEVQEVLSRTTLSFDGLQCTFMKGLRRGKESNKFDLVLDIDAYGVPEKALNDSDLSDLLQRLRDLKNKVFEANITDKTRGLFV